MIRQELMDNIQELKNKLEVVIDIKYCGIDKLEMVKDAYLLATKLETMVADELESQRQELSDTNMMVIDELDTPFQESDFEQYKSYCEENGLKPSSGKVLNEYFKKRGV